MRIPLPELFCTRMEQMLQQEYESFLQGYEQAAWHGLRVNPLKVDPARFVAISPFELHPVPWCNLGFYYSGVGRPGKHPYHAAGLYYLQEPSAMAVAEALDVQPGDVVLDLCAAPGGKSTQIAAALQGQGLLVANEIHPTRAKALSENIERLGVTNAIVTNETPERLAARFHHAFDRILVDAPCSGEGMFRKLPEACDDWSLAKVAQCHAMQCEILQAAAQMLKPGGTLVYSTCTFAPEENEQTVEVFLADHPGFTLVPTPHREQFRPGQADWAKRPDNRLSLSARLWPHHLRGEGHFIAKMVKQQADPSDEPTFTDNSRRSPRKKGAAKPAISREESIAAWRLFAENTVIGAWEKTNDSDAFTLFGEQLYYLPPAAPNLDGLKVLRPGWHLGTMKKNRFEPSHALALALSADQCMYTADFHADDPLLLRYLRGESLPHEAKNGWTLIRVDTFSLGWAKQSDRQLKNHYPKGLRWL
ncbi:RsmB/NOP family class I SAM-dependent RNA methyltransferase [Brevibacillus humidisoli]|uniref:RsmF rRNA methyltransferase first C-terminal domain-containing protein n=1 Tax=Brevibacillus humidisoli TaxID=2895522 RepID=UPI001E39B0A4|nr:RsmB/NOP family class I SAM-dependent RNA methyltransferase [Brevibacillus humidisoli]UFJ39405.1 RsmB/NOP family class I SAM-dependent RNA methyltransferase [Brevibacillus humidisoli]